MLWQISFHGGTHIHTARAGLILRTQRETERLSLSLVRESVEE